MIRRLWAWLIGDTLGVIPRWTAARIRAAERDTFQYLGVNQRHFDWWRRRQAERARRVLP